MKNNINVNQLLKKAQSLYDSNQWRESNSVLSTILGKFPSNEKALDLQFGNFIKLNQWDQALFSADKLVKINPSVKNVVNKGSIFIIKTEFQKALTLFAQVEKQGKNNPLFLINKGIALRNLYRYDEAIEILLKAKELDPDHADASMHLGIAYHEILDIDRAIEEFHHAIRMAPTEANLYWNLALTLLTKGDYRQGWHNWESRFYQSQVIVPQRPEHVRIPNWDLKTRRPGMRLMVETEQGIGDIIHFSRFIRPMADQGIRVTIMTGPHLKSLMQQVDGAETVYIPQEGPAPDCDYICYLASLPYVLGTTLETIPPPMKFEAPADRKQLWKSRLGAKTRPKVGLVWSGNPDYLLDRRRSIPLTQFSSILIPGIDFYSVNKDISDLDSLLTKEYGIQHIGNEIRDWQDTEAIIESMDLMICVSTSVQALSASMGKETWLAISYSADWRWLLNRTDSPWYPGLTLYRQHQPGNDWSLVLSKIKADLQVKFVDRLH